MELASKPAHDLDVPASEEAFLVGKVQGGYTREFGTWRGLAPGVGGSVSAGIVPRALEGVYGDRVNVGVGCS